MPNWFYDWYLDQLPEAIIAGVITGLVVAFVIYIMGRQNQSHCSFCCPSRRKGT